jgi:hypothetical protein
MFLEDENVPLVLGGLTHADHALKFFSACSADAKQCLAYTQCKLKIVSFF